MNINKEEYKHYVIGENKLCFPNHEYIIKLDFPRVYIRYKLKEACFANYDEFYSNIAEVQWLDGQAPPEQEKESILINAYNFLAIDEWLLENDLSDIDEIEG